MSLLSLGLGAAATGSATAAPSFSRVYAYGDSLGDVGNFFLATGQPPAPYDQRFSNGPVWVEQLAGLVGATPVLPSLAGGSGFAWGFARATDSGVPAPLTPSLSLQVGAFLQSGHAPQVTELYTVWAGANDLFDGQLDPTLSAAAVVTQVTALVNAGARNLVVLDLPPIHTTPDFQLLTAKERADAAGWVGAFNATLATGLDQLELTLTPETNLYRFDTTAFFNDITSNPGDYGLTNVTDRVFVTSPAPGFAGDPDQYLFWDGVHPTTVGHGHLAAAVLGVVPEPSSAVMVMSMVGLAALRRRRAA